MLKKYILIIVSALCLAALSTSLSGSKAVLADSTARCVDGYALPSSVLFGGTEDQFCASHGGYQASGGARCVSGYLIPVSAITGGTEDQFCAQYGGYNPKDGARCVDGYLLPANAFTSGSENQFCASHGGLTPTSASPLTTPSPSSTSTSCAANSTNCIPSDCGGDNQPACDIKSNQIITEIINPAIKIFSILIGVVAVIMLIISGIIYSASQDDPKRIALAKKIIIDVVIAIAVYVFLFAILNYLLPQGVKGG